MLLPFVASSKGHVILLYILDARSAALDLASGGAFVCQGRGWGTTAVALSDAPRRETNLNTSRLVNLAVFGTFREPLFHALP